MIHAAVDDFGALDHTSTSVGAVLGTLALLSTSEDALGVESQVIIIGRRCVPYRGRKRFEPPVSAHLGSRRSFVRDATTKVGVAKIQLGRRHRTNCEKYISFSNARRMTLIPERKYCMYAVCQEMLLSSSASILGEAAEKGFWDSSISTATLGVLDGVIGSYGDSSGAVVGTDEIGDAAAKK